MHSVAEVCRMFGKRRIHRLVFDFDGVITAMQLEEPFLDFIDIESQVEID